MQHNNEYINMLVSTLEDLNLDPLKVMAKIIHDTSRTIYVVGNGDSAATADHLVNDLVKTTGHPAVSLSGMTALMTAMMNDEGQEQMYAKMITHYVDGRDVFFAISCSGFSLNIVEAAKLCKRAGVTVLSFTGSNRASPLVEYSHHVFNVPHPDIRIQEDIHFAMVHLLCQMIIELKS